MQGGNGCSQHPSAGEGPSIVYTFQTIDLQTRAKSYGALVTHAEETSSSQNTPPPNNLHIKRPISDLVIHPAKGPLHLTMKNTSTHAAQNYSTVEDLA